MVKHYCDLCGSEITQDYLIGYSESNPFKIPRYMKKIKEYWAIETELCEKCCARFHVLAESIREEAKK